MHPMKKALLLTAGLSALTAAALSRLYLNRLETEVSGGPRVAVLAAAQDLPAGTQITEGALAVREIPKAYLEARHIKKEEMRQVIGVRVASGLRSGEAMLWSDINRWTERGRQLSGLVPEGRRAVPIELRSAPFHGLLRPGDRVDVLLSRGQGNSTGGTITLLQNALVLSVGNDISPASENRAADERASSATLSLSAEQAQIVVQAQSKGRLSLTLRNPDDLAMVDGLKEVERLPENELVNPEQRNGVEHVR